MPFRKSKNVEDLLSKFSSRGRSRSPRPSEPDPAPAEAATAPTPTPTLPGEPFRSRGDKLSQEGNYNGAAVMYDSALEIAPHNFDLLLKRSLVHTMTTPARLDLALEDANQAITEQPTNPQGWIQKGEVLIKMGNNQDAQMILSDAVKFATGSERFTAERALAAARSLSIGSTQRPQSWQYQTTSTPPASSHSSPNPVAATPTAGSTAPTTPLPPMSQEPPVFPSNNTAPSPRNPVQVTAAAGPPAPPASSAQQSVPPAATSSSASSTPPSRPLPQASPSILAPTGPSGQNAPSTDAPRSQSSPSPAAAGRTTQNPSRSTTQGPTANNATSAAPSGTTIRRDTQSSPHSIAQGLLEELNIADLGSPPAYTEDLRDPVVFDRKLREFEQALKVKRKGSLAIRPLTLPGSIDAVQLVYTGLTQAELTPRETGTVPNLHPNLAHMTVNAYNYPGNTFLDADCETSAYYEGKIPGTVTVSGYSEEYRAQQLRQAPLFNLMLEGSTVLPEYPLSAIVERLRKIRFTLIEDTEGLRSLVGLSQLDALRHGFYTGGDRQKQIDFICIALNRSKHDAASRFPDLSMAPFISSHFIGTLSTGDGLRNFLYQILLGCELLIRLRKQPVSTSYTGLMTDSTSALLVLGALWMQFVTITGPTNSNMKDSPSSYTFSSSASQSQAEALIRFGEAISWPYMDEARNCIETVYKDMIAKKVPSNLDMWDWLFNLVLPGKIYRHKIMSVLVFASPSVRHFNAAPYYDNGLVVNGRSYWPKRTVLGRVLGGRRIGDVKSVCGWIGPLPAPRTNVKGWVRLDARNTTIPVPVSASPSQDPLEEFGFTDTGSTDRYTLLESFLDPNEWVETMPPTLPANDQNQSKLKAINLTLVDQTTSTSLPGLPPEVYRASLDFEINGQTVTYTLYSNPVFVTAAPCVGTHVMHKREGQQHLRNIVRARDLKNTNPTLDKLMIIDALGQGEEVVARAWCAERARNAIIRRGNECCFACATSLASSRFGLGCNVLILSL